MPVLIGLVSREAGKTAASAVAEIREAVDFLRYYGAEAVRLHAIRLGIGAPLGPVVCISPWNFPLAIFTGQIAAALAAGNTVLAKPSGETALIAAEAVRILHRAGIPADAVQLLPGDGVVGAALVADPRTSAVMFTGSTAVARQIQRQLADRLTPAGQPVPLIAETGGQNALVVDSSALAEQVVADVITSAFDSAGQRCSALRILCVQEDVADRILAMLKGALHELEIGNPGRLAVDIGPVITARARDAILNHVTTMRARGHAVEQLALPAETAHGTFVPPTIIEIARIGDVEHEVFGPVLHVLRYRRDDLDDVIDAINATGYGLTFGLHTRIDETIARVTSRIQAGNIYINRNIIGATVGVQPFGGTGLSGTGPKAGGPLYLERLMRSALPAATRSADIARTTAHAYVDWLRSCGQTEAAAICAAMLDRSALGISIDLAGPVGERNLYLQRPRGRILALAATTTGLLVQLGAILVTGNHAVIERGQSAAGILAGAVPEITSRIRLTDDWHAEADLAAVLFEGPQDAARTLLRAVADRDGPILQVQIAAPTTTPRGSEYRLNLLLEERSISTNTAAAGGNASLMSIG